MPWSTSRVQERHIWLALESASLYRWCSVHIFIMLTQTPKHTQTRVTHNRIHIRKKMEEEDVPLSRKAVVSPSNKRDSSPQHQQLVHCCVSIVWCVYSCLRFGGPCGAWGASRGRRVCVIETVSCMGAAASSSPPEMELDGLSPEETAAVEWVRTMVRDSGGKKVRHTDCLLVV